MANVRKKQVEKTAQTAADAGVDSQAAGTANENPEVDIDLDSRGKAAAAKAAAVEDAEMAREAAEAAAEKAAKADDGAEAPEQKAEEKRKIFSRHKEDENAGLSREELIAKATREAEEAQKEADNALETAQDALDKSGVIAGRNSARKAKHKYQDAREKAKEARWAKISAENDGLMESAIAAAEAEAPEDIQGGGNAPARADNLYAPQTTRATQADLPKFTFTVAKNGIEGGASAIDALVAQQRAYFKSNITIPFDWRDRALQRFNALIDRYQTPLVEALHRDLGISKYEAYMTEIAPLYEEIAYVRKNLEKWTTHRSSNMFSMEWFKLLPSRHATYWHPLGCSCIINSWKSPVLMAAVPMVYALGAGCTIVIKNSDRTWRCNEVLSAAITELFKNEYVRFIYGGDDLDEVLVNADFDKIYYNGPSEKGQTVLKAAANSMAQTTLMLDGNNPCYVDTTFDLRVAAQRIMWGKMLHAGQTRISPSWVYAHNGIHKAFINRLYEYVKKTYGDKPIESKDYPRMFSRKEYDQACEIIDNAQKRGEVVFGGERNPKTLKIAPTVMLVDSINHPVFKKKIVGPILPVVTFDHPEDAFAQINKLPTPPAFYLFTKNKSTRKYAFQYVSFCSGGDCDTMMQIANRSMPYSAMGNAGMGQLGGLDGLQCFGIRQTVVVNRGKRVNKWRFPPFPDTINSIKRRFHYRQGGNMH